MKLDDLIKIIDVNSDVIITGEEVGTYGFIRESIWGLLGGYYEIRKRNVLSLDITGVKHELTIMVEGRI